MSEFLLGVYVDLLFAVIAACLVHWSRVRTARLVTDKPAAIILRYGWKSRLVVVLSWLFIAIQKTWIAANDSSITLLDLLIVLMICLFFFICTVSTFNHAIIIDGERVTSISTFFPDYSVDLGNMKGARETSTLFFGGVTIFKKGAHCVKIRHQLPNHGQALEAIRSAIHPTA